MSEAILLVGGQGTRLRPLTVSTPKPLLPVAGAPFLEHVLARIHRAGLRRVVLATSFRAEVFEEYFADRGAAGHLRLDGLDIDYAVENVPLGTGGAIRNAAQLLSSGPDDPVLVFNGDILSGVDITGLLAAHTAADADVTLHLTRVSDPRAFGLVPTDTTGRVTAFTEKPERPEQVVTDQVNAGCYVFRRQVIESIPAGRPVSVERETFPGLLAGDGRVQGVVDEEYWLDVGTPAAYVRGSADLVRGLLESPALPGAPGERLLLDGARVDRTAVVTGGSVLGPGAEVGPGAVVESSVLLAEASVGADTRVQSSALGRGSRVGACCVLRDAVVGDLAVVGEHNELLDGVRVWCDVTLPAGAVRFSADG